MASRRRIRLFLDSNVLTGGIVSPWGLDKAALSLCAARLCRLVLAEIVRDEVEENLLLHAERLPSLAADKLIEHYRRLIKLTKPEMIPYPDESLVRSSRHLHADSCQARGNPHRNPCRVLSNLVITVIVVCVSKHNP